MRRLLISVAFLAALLIAPSAALATGKPSVTFPATGAAVSTVSVSWGDVSLLGETITYTLFRDVPTPACSTAIPGSAIQVGTTNGLTLPDPVTAEGSYCYWVEANDGLTGPADSDPVLITLDRTPPAISVTQTGGNGCVAYSVSATATDNLTSIVMTANTNAYTQGAPLTPGSGTPFSTVSTTFTATDAAGNAPTPVVVSGTSLDDTRPPAPLLEITTDPAAQKATLSWDSVTAEGAPVTGYHVHVKGPQGVSDPTLGPDATSLVFGDLQVDATYEYSLTAKDVCGESAASVRLVRLNDTTPPSTPIVAQPAFVSAAKAVALSWVPSTDNIQIDHYQILRDGSPLGITDASAFTDTTPKQASTVSYVVRAVDTNGNIADSDAKPVKIPDWTPPTPPVAVAKPNGTTVTVTWNAAADNVGVVGYDVLRDGRAVASMTGAVHKYTQLNVKPGSYQYVVRARDDAGNGADSTGQSIIVKKPHVTATVVGVKMAGALRGGASRYAIKGPARLLLDVRIVGTLKQAKVRVYVQSGKGRITVWRGTPGSSSPRERLHSAIVHHGWVTIKLNRTLHAGRTRLVLIASDRMVIAGKGAHKPTMLPRV